jgi:hypothetical protein
MNTPTPAPFCRAALALALLVATALPATAAGGKGMTWAKVAHDSSLGIDHLSCDGCDPYEGDTSCKRALPVLCVKRDGAPRPNYAVAPVGGSMDDEAYRGWLEGHVAVSLPVVGTLLVSEGVANGVCRTQFGPGWRIAEFHDGRWKKGMNETTFYGNASNSPSPWPEKNTPYRGGWGFFAYGNVPEDQRFWVYIDDTRGNCWNR